MPTPSKRKDSPTPGPANRAEDAARSLPKYRVILNDLKTAIESGALAPGARLKTEAELGQQYQASRITVAKAVNELMQLGLVSRRAGSGTHVLARANGSGHVFGLLIPDLGRTEIFEPICQGMMKSPLARSHSLLWGNGVAEDGSQAEAAISLCRDYIRKKVSGVFFAPLEFSPEREQANQVIARELEEANIPIVLLDRCYGPYPFRSRHDLVGIDNHAAGQMITLHLLGLGKKRPVFLSRALSASTVLGRISGYREALYRSGFDMHENLVREGDADDQAWVRALLEEVHPDSFVCANDITAGRLISTLDALGVDVPGEMSVVGIDDVKHAGLFRVPLTTQHQNCGAIGATAIATMLERLAQPDLPVRDVLLQTTTVVRASCGAQLREPGRTQLPEKKG